MDRQKTNKINKNGMLLIRVKQEWTPHERQRKGEPRKAPLKR